VAKANANAFIIEPNEAITFSNYFEQPSLKWRLLPSVLQLFIQSRGENKNAVSFRSTFTTEKTSLWSLVSLLSLRYLHLLAGFALVVKNNKNN